MIHYLSSTAVNTENGVKHLAFCGEQLDYYDDRDKFRCHSLKEVTHFRCVVEYAKTYPMEYKQWAKMDRSLRAERAAGIDYDWETGNFSHNGIVLSEAEYVKLLVQLNIR